MSTATTTVAIRREPELLGQTVVVIGGSAGIGLETARRARAEGARLILAARNPERLQQVARELNTQSTVAFDATDFDRLARFFDELATPIDHVLVTGPGPYTRPWPSSILKRRTGMLRPICFCRCTSLVTPQTRFAREELSSSWGGLVAAARLRIRSRLGSHRCAARPHRRPRARTRARSSQPHRRRLRRHTVVGIAPRRRARQPPQSASRHAPHPARRFTGRRCRARRTHHDQPALTGATYDIDGGQQLVAG